MTTLTKRQITARNRPIREMFDQAVRDGVINRATNWFLHTVLDCCGAHEYTNAKRETLAQLVGKCLSTIKNYLRAAVDAGLVWIEEHTHRIWISALVPPPKAEPEVVQLSLVDEQGGAIFCPESGNFLPSHLKVVNSDLNSFGGGSASASETESETDGESELGTRNSELRTKKTPTHDPSSAAAPVVEQPVKNFVDPVAAAELRQAGLANERTILEMAAHPIRTIRSAIAVQKREGKGAGYTVFLLTNPAILAQKEALYVNQQRNDVPRRRDQDAAGRTGEARKPWADVGPSRALDGSIPEQPAERPKPWADVGPSRPYEL